jgi:DNA-binding response OmpR family regulator
MDAERIHVLVVDDLADMAESTAELLTLWGYDATPCTSGVAALACARVRRPAAVLLDLVMPRMDGFEFARTFRALTGCGAVPLIALSGCPFPASSVRIREAGIGHYVSKPADPARLKALLVSVIRSASVEPGLQVGKRRNPRRPSRRTVAVLVPA